MKAYGPSYRRALVLGLGASGEAAAEFIVGRGTHVLAVDRRKSSDLVRRTRGLKAAGADVRLGVGDLQSLFDAPCPGGTGEAIDICVISPGIPSESEWLAPLRRTSVRIVSEIELGALCCTKPIVAVTGSNGKSTCVKLCGDVMQAAGYRARLTGNYGLPLTRAVAHADGVDWLVTEVSSFQLENVSTFAPRIAVLLNIDPDHLDRHGNMATYTALKSRIFDRMQEADTAVVHEAVLESVRRRTRGRPRWVSFGTSPSADYRYEPGRVGCLTEEGRRTVSLVGTAFDNEVTGLTAAAVLAVARTAGIDVDAWQRAVAAYQPLPHRLQEVGCAGSVRFIDDSKATNIAALCAALRMVDAPVRLIAGGVLKEEDVDRAKELLAKKAKGAYLIGASARMLESVWSSVVRCERFRSLREATQTAWRESDAGDVVLLSPGCSSFDQFRNYEDRGNQFQRIVRTIEEE